MGLFQDDTSAEEYFEYQKARQNFTKKNVEMKDTIEIKTSDPKNVKFDQVHIEIYENVELGSDWRVDKTISSEEIETASNGFQKVTKNLKKYQNRSIESRSLLGLIRSFFRK